MAHPVTWFQISGADGKALQGFYKKVFAWKMTKAPDGSGMMMVHKEEGGIAGGIGSAPASGTTVYVDAAHLERQLAKIERNGGKTTMPPMELPAGMGRIAVFSDPAGNTVGLWQQPKSAPPAPRKAAAKRAAAKKAAAPKKAAKKAAAPKKAAKKAAAPKKAAARKRR